MCGIEKHLENENKMPLFYKRYVDDTFTIMPDIEKATEFLWSLTWDTNVSQNKAI